MPKVGYVAVIGRPNAGKSTLLNALIGEKVSAVSSRPQTTQRAIPAIYTDEENELQIIFLDTPGLHSVDGSDTFTSERRGNISDIHGRINTEALRSLSDADVILRLVDPTRPPGQEDTLIESILEKITTPILRIETKQDGKKSYPGKDIDLKIDSLSGAGFGELIEKIRALLPDGPYLYEADFYTDQTMDFRIAECVREALFEELGEEIPYACYVEVDAIDNTATLLKAQAYIYTETESQKKVVIGKWGKKIQTLGTQARINLETIFGKKVFLSLRVKVEKNWRKNTKILDKIFPKK